jgi:hypothetical protein
MLGADLVATDHRAPATVAPGGGLPQQVRQQRVEALPELWRQIGPPELSEAVEVQLCCGPSSRHGVEPPHSKE